MPPDVDDVSVPRGTRTENFDHPSTRDVRVTRVPSVAVVASLNVVCPLWPVVDDLILISRDHARVCNAREGTH